jgi:hypothetical protein
MFGLIEEDIEIKVFSKKTGKEIKTLNLAKSRINVKWEKVVAKQLASVIGLSGNKSAQFIAYTISEKDSENRIFGTYKTLAKNSDVSHDSVKRIVPKLLSSGYLKELQAGVYMVDPKTIRPGERWRGSALIEIWDEI